MDAVGQFHRHPDANYLLLDGRTHTGDDYSVAFHELTLVPVGPEGHELWLVLDSRSTNNLVRNRATFVAYEELEEYARRRGEEKLTLDKAAEESGYTADHLSRLVRDGTVPNAGEPGSPRIRRADLPRKPGHRGQPASLVDDPIPSRMQMARSVVNSD